MAPRALTFEVSKMAGRSSRRYVQVQISNSNTVIRLEKSKMALMIDNNTEVGTYHKNGLATEHLLGMGGLHGQNLGVRRILQAFCTKAVHSTLFGIV